MDNRKHMRTEKKTAVKNSFGRLLATGIFVLICGSKQDWSADSFVETTVAVC